MKTMFGCFVCVVAFVAAPAAAATSLSFSDDFESGLGNWTPMVMGTPQGPDNDTPVEFTPTDDRLGQSVGANLSNPGSTSAGYYRDLGVPYDWTQAAWLQKQWPGGLDPGTYDVTLELDLYVWGAPAPDGPGGDQWGVGNRLYVLTDDRYNDPGWNFDGGDPSPGARFSNWNHEAQPAQGYWEHKVKTLELTTTTGDIELRLLNHDKFDGMQAVAWDNVQFTITPEPATAGLLCLGALPLLLRRRRH